MARQVDSSEVAANLVSRMKWLLETLEGDVSAHPVTRKLDAFESMWNTLEQGLADLRVREHGLGEKEKAARNVEEQQSKQASLLEDRANQIREEFTTAVSENASKVVRDVTSHLSDTVANLLASSPPNDGKVDEALLAAISTKIDEVATRVCGNIQSFKTLSDKSLAELPAKIVSDVSRHVDTKVDSLRGTSETAMAELSKKLDDNQVLTERSYSLQSTKLETLEKTIGDAAKKFDTFQNSNGRELNGISKKIVGIRNDTTDIANKMDKLDRRQTSTDSFISETYEYLETIVGGVATKVQDFRTANEGLHKELSSQLVRLDQNIADDRQKGDRADKLQAELDKSRALATVLEKDKKEADKKADEKAEAVVALESRASILENDKRILQASLDDSRRSNGDQLGAVTELEKKIREKDEIIAANSANIQERDRIAASHSVTIKERDEVIVSHLAKIKELEQVVEKGARLEVIIKERDEALCEVTKLQSLVSQANDRFNSQTKRVEDLEKELEEIRPFPRDGDGQESKKRPNTKKNDNALDNPAAKRRRTVEASASKGGPETPEAPNVPYPPNASEPPSDAEIDMKCWQITSREWRRLIDTSSNMLYMMRPARKNNGGVTVEDAIQALIWATFQEKRWDYLTGFLNHGPQDAWFCFKALAEKGWQSQAGRIAEGGRCPEHGVHDCIWVFNAGDQLPRDTLLFKRGIK